MIPDLNQVIDIYSQEFSAGGDSEVTLLYGKLRARVSLGEKLIKQPSGDYIQIDGNAWIDGSPELARDQILFFNEKYYTIYSVSKTRDLNGKPLFQHLTLRINKNVVI